MITEDEIDNIFLKLKDSIEEHARKKSYLSALLEHKKVIIATAKHYSKATTIDERDTEARLSKEYKDWIIKYEDAVYQFDRIHEQRTHLTITWERWRTEFSALKQGIVF